MPQRASLCRSTRSRSARRALAGTAALGSLLVASPALAEPAVSRNTADSAAISPHAKAATAKTADGKPIIVYGRSEKRIGIAGAASEGGVAGADIEVRPLLRPAELLEATPGLIATQHSGGGKANQYFLRGFNLDHGTDFSTYIDDMPMNFRTHGHGQGYLDVNGLIPESVERVDYRKGPYRADTGDFSFVGTALVTTRDRMQPFVLGEGGMYDYYRAVAGGSVPLGAGDLLAIGQAKFNNGPWQLPEAYAGYSGMVKYSAPLGSGEFKVSLHAYAATWAPTEQIPERAVGVEIANRFGSLDPYLRGRTARESLTLNYTDDSWKITAWAQHYNWSLLSNFTFYLNDPVHGDELRQYEKMWGYGGRIERKLPLADALQLMVGTELRQDDIGQVGLDHTEQGVVLDTRTVFNVRESSAALYAEATWRPLPRLMVIGGLRGDWYRFRTIDLGGELGWSGLVNAAAFSPKLGINYELVDGFALYANWGQGFHSNDARGVTNPDSPAPGLVEGNMEEAGFRLERGGLILTAVYWWSYIGSELIYVGDSGSVQPTGPGRRRGYELTAFWKPTDWLAVDAVWTGSHARYADLPAGENYVPGALESAGELGLSAIFPGWNASLRLRYLGPHALLEDNSQRGRQTLLVNLRAAWTPNGGKHWEFFADLLNALNSKSDDIDYYYTTRLPGEPAAGIDGINSRIVEPRQLRIGVKRSF